ISPIEKAINAAGLGVNAMSDAELVRVPIPPLTEERRKEYVKIVKHKGEEHKIAIRNERRDAKEMIEEAVKEGDLTEDDGKKGLDSQGKEINPAAQVLVRDVRREVGEIQAAVKKEFPGNASFQGIFKAQEPVPADPREVLALGRLIAKEAPDFAQNLIKYA